MSSEVAADYGVSGLPAFFVIGRDANVVDTGADWKKIKPPVVNSLRRAGTGD
jgi:hypothetical protein